MERCFLWDTNQSSRKFHPINWKKVCMKKSDGGLGVMKLKSMNKAFFMKIAWNIITKSNAAWVKVIKEKYRFDTLSEGPKQKASCSNLWRGICRIWSSFFPHVKKVVNND
ncbi:putative ribonuclease H protein At1g65750 family [Senna tora]|uniref:Putative ribonuclease H protein At1g65750 family n=1 Tax=Senna tora TaxID=362788 RepID=A0A834TN22_9FABA|nr:putative ribonuclease H protein At1g65750 family [Senna tora]